ncbi:hypothetical protein Dacet_0104 [Denitrovibrio acetiphilus DSM 12809]|uniref:DUF4412 domain-containing protein n=1 Tax=Denitrovibrio acetiphilus (strain DSM 12809 / NBRC 114555 / N2460) TaxID=522772 RepID=D4H1G2_DENA2|nr:DUF4412 domain-containing protein [Denitrovibrio acetiphilus]ADD66910.1 hypothetical protein Dacet_0104 [Denitrovibrio acetiphilus DSM 12809]
MKNIIIIAAMLCFSYGYADITVTEESDGSKMVTYYADNVSAHYIDGHLTNITDISKSLITVLNPMEKTYFQATFEEMRALAEQLNEQMKAMAENPQFQELLDRHAGKVDIKKDGTTTIAGYKCDKYLLSMEEMGASAEVCFSKELGDALQKEVDIKKAEKLMDSLEIDGMGDMIGVKISELEEKAGYPLSEKTDSTMFGMEDGYDRIVTEISKTKIKKSVFSIPDGYEKITIDQAMGNY